MWYVWKVAIWDLFPMPPRRDTTAVMGSVAGRVSAIIGLWATITVLLWAWYAEENRSSDMADILLMWTGLLVLVFGGWMVKTQGVPLDRKVAWGFAFVLLAPITLPLYWYCLGF